MKNSTDNQLNEEDGTRSTPKRKCSRAKPTVCCEWKKTDVFQLIECVKQYPCLWNYSSNDHRNLNLRNSSWRSIEQQLGNRFTVNDCKAKWTNVRTAYQRTKANFCKSTSGQATSDVKPHLSYWSAMQFVDSQEAAITTASESSFTFKTFANEQLSVDQLESGLNDDSTSQSVITPKTLQATGSSIAPRRRKPQASQPSNPLVSIATKSMERVAKILGDLDKKGEEDEWQIIANYWALQLRIIAERDPVCARRTHFEVSKIILEACMQPDLLHEPVSTFRNART